MKQRSKFVIISILVIAIIDIFISYEISISKKVNNYGFTGYKDVQSINYTEMKNGTVLTQTFTGRYENLNCITIGFSDIISKDTNIKQSIIIGIRDLKTGEKLAENEVLMNHIREEKNYNLKFKTQKQSKDRQYEIYVKCANENDNELLYTTKYYNYDVYEEGSLKIDGKETGFDLDFKDVYLNTKKILYLYAILVALNIMMFAISYCIYKQKSISPEKMLIALLPMFAILMCLTITMGNGKDEAAHFYRIYDISQGNLITKKYQDKALAYIPEAAKDVFYYRRGTYEDLINRVGKTSIEKGTILISIPASAVYSPLQYIPQVAGVTISKLITKDPVIISYAGRLFNMMACIAFLYFTIKIAPFGKNIFLILSFLPATVAGISTLSADGITISLCFLFIAYVLRLAFKEGVSVGKRDLLLLGVFSIFIAACKIVYLPLLGLLLIIPKEKWGGIKKKAINISLLWLLGIIISVSWLSVASGMLAIDRNGDSIIKLATILENPFKYLQTIISTIPYNIEAYINSMFGGDIEHDGILIFHMTPYILMFLSIGVSFMDKDIKSIQINNFQKAIIILVCLAVMLLIFTSLYLQWTEYGVNYIKGIQGRYFIPFLPLVLILLGRINFEGRYAEEVATKVVGITTTILQIGIVMLIVLFHI